MASEQLTATVTMSSGATQDVTDQATWVSSDESVATVSGGLVTAQAVGECEVTATYEGLSGACSVTVTDPAETLSVSPSSISLDLS